MDRFQLTVLGRPAHNSLAHSALPDAPVVDDTARFVRARAVAAGLLHRVADLVAPDPTPSGSRLATTH
jgi:hypothetical protein